jgi:hypothetical protein
MAEPNFSGFTAEEHESLINYDEAAGELVLYTTRPHVWRHWLRRLQGAEGVRILAAERTIRVPLAYARRPWLVLKAHAKTSKRPAPAQG